jgi:DNA-binding LacI/PurR family transcriptional regulator
VVLGGQPGGRVKIIGDRMSCVDADNPGGAQAAVGHLLERGRHRIAAIAGPQDMGVGVARLSGYRRALQAAGLPVDESRVGYGDFSEASGASVMRTLLERHPDLDAVFAASDLMAVGAMRVLREHGRRIPADVAVVGFEDSVLARQTEPALTTVHQPVGRWAGDGPLLVAHIRATSCPPRSSSDTHLVIRDPPTRPHITRPAHASLPPSRRYDLKVMIGAFVTVSP